MQVFVMEDAVQNVNMTTNVLQMNTVDTTIFQELKINAPPRKTMGRLVCKTG